MLFCLHGLLKMLKTHVAKQTLCTVCMYSMHVQYVYTVCMYSMHVQCACTVCMYSMHDGFNSSLFHWFHEFSSKENFADGKRTYKFITFLYSLWHSLTIELFGSVGWQSKVNLAKLCCLIIIGHYLQLQRITNDVWQMKPS